MEEGSSSCGSSLARNEVEGLEGISVNGERVVRSGSTLLMGTVVVESSRGFEVSCSESLISLSWLDGTTSGGGGAEST